MSKFSETDDKLKALIRDNRLSPSRIRGYDSVFKEIYELFGYTPSQLLEIARNEEKSLINEHNQIVTIEMDNRTIYKIQAEYFDYISKDMAHGRPLKPKTIKNKMATYRRFLRFYEVTLPNPIKIDIPKNRIRDKDIPTWQDVKRATELAKSPRDRAVILFCATTGLRVSDVVLLKISDFVDACEIYFEENEIKNLKTLLSKDPDNIVPCWELNPQKTQRHSNLTVTFNTPEATSLIFDYLNYRIELRLKKGKSTEIGLDEPLFSSQRGGFLKTLSLEKQCAIINDKMGGEKDRNGLYGKFRLQNLRKLFKTTCRRGLQKIKVNSDKTFDGDIISLFTGHITPNNPLAEVYEAVEDDSHESYIRKVYQSLIPYLSIYPTETKAFKEQEYLEMEEKIESLEEQSLLKDVEHQRDLEEKDKEINELKKLLEETTIKVNETSKAMEEFKLRKNSINMRNYIIEYCDENYTTEDYNKFNLICQMAIIYANENKDEFEFNKDYVANLIKKMEIKMSLSKDSILEQLISLGVMNNEKPNEPLLYAINDIMEIINDNDKIRSIVGDIDTLKIEDLLELYLIESGYDLTDLTEDNKLEIAEKALMDYIE